MLKLITTWGYVFFILLAPRISKTCSVPIYQYALENWTTDDYQILVFRDQQTDSTVADALRHLEAAATDSLPNFTLEYRSAAEFDSVAATDKISFPWMLAFFPKTSKSHNPFWEGPVTEENVRKLIDSPVRQQLVQRISGGEAAVWLLLETGYPKTDSIFARTLNESLKKLSKELKVAGVSVDSLSTRVSHPDSAEISVRFSWISLKPNDPEESIFRRMLLGFEPDLFLLTQPLRQPLAVPVFGRGRALYSLIGQGINEKMIRRACESIIGWCSCEVKAENPGMDLLVKANWINFVPQLPPPEIPPLTGISRFLPARIDSSPAIENEPVDTVLLVEPAGFDSTVQDTVIIEIAAPTRSSPLWVSLFWIFLVGVFGVLAATFFMMKRKHFQ